MKITELRTKILSTIANNPGIHAYAIRVGDTRERTVTATCKALSDEGLVRFEEEWGNGGRARKKLYVTSKGEHALADAVEAA